MIGAAMGWSRRSPPIIERVDRFKGMRSTMQGAVDPRFCEWLHNCHPANPYDGGELVARVGRQSYPPTVVGINQVGPLDTTERRIQLWTSFVDPTNQLYSLVSIVGGKFYSDKAGAGFVEAVNATTFTAASITLSASDSYYGVMFNGRLVICGPSFAFTWDGTTNGGIVKLTNAGTSFYGQPVIHAAKVWFIRGNRRDVVWSEEGDETIGYEVGHTNVWNLRQTSAEPITVLLPSNTGLSYFRRGSIGTIYGADATTFQSTATLDAISATEGTDCTEGAVLTGDTVWFIDNRGRPACYSIGSTTIIPLWKELERAFTPYFQDGGGYSGLAAPNVEALAFSLFSSNNQVVYFRSLDMVFFTYRYFQSSQPDSAAMDVMIGFHAKTRTVQTVWSFPTGIGKVTEVYDRWYGSGEFALAIADIYGYVYTINFAPNLGLSPTQPWYTDRDLRFGDVDVAASVIGPRHFNSLDHDLRVRRLDLDIIGFQSGGTIDVRWVTPQINQGGVRARTDQPLTVALDGAGRPLPGSPAVVGFNELCRWIAFGFSWKAQATRARLTGWQVTAQQPFIQPRARAY